MVEMIRIIKNCDDVSITASHFYDVFWGMHRQDPKYKDIWVRRAKLPKDERVLIEYSLHGVGWRRVVLGDESDWYELPPSARIRFLAGAEGAQKVRLRIDPLKSSDPEPVLSEQGVVEFFQLFIAYLRDEGFEVQEPQGPTPAEDKVSKKHGPTVKTQIRAKVFKQLKDEHPEWSQAKVAIEACDKLGEYVTADTVRNAYRAMGWEWKRADRIR